MKKILIIGNGVSGINVAGQIRKIDKDIEIDVFTDERYHYYPRPRLIELLAGRIGVNDIYFYPDQWYKNNGINIYLNTPIREIEPKENKVVALDGKEFFYGKLVIASGASPSLPPIKGREKNGVFSIRKLEDVLSLKERVRSRGEAIAIGGGLLGLEIASALQSSGIKVTVLELLPWLLPRQLDKVGGDFLQKMLEDRGLEIFTGVTTEEILGEIEVSGVLTKDGNTIKGDTVVITAGIKSNIELAKICGANTNKGIVVDDHLRTSIDNIYACGDVAEWNGKVYGIIPSALDQAKVVAQNILGENVTYKGTVPSNMLKVAGIDLFSIGMVNPEEGYEIVSRLDDKRNIYKKFVIKDNKIVGAIVLGERKNVQQIERIIEEEIDISNFKDSILEDDFNWRDIL
ncbi:MAG: NAD(P)/FAD-dependent oxidoreductase [bacterium]